ncbi:ariadne-1 [Piedraia hortae CBS 480.64]|uniref:RBR-type E3 ubiquitin transferase n=1 Tax=Piedraia hortae CBS 480.64 TaxID=1314780 RepID=A0A6A7C645_9PEZI|nr:ariadne-1 [Piedraia hortae CBS 480.64]
MESDDDMASVTSSGLDDTSSVGFGADESDEDFVEYQSDDSDAYEAEKPKKSAFEVDYTVYSPSAIQEQQDKQVSEVAMLMNQPREAAAILLRYARWNKEWLVDKYVDNEENLLKSAGLGEASKTPPRIEKKPGFECEICCEDGSGLDTFALSCGHRFCVNCYRHYLDQKISEEGEAARIRCPGEGCNQILDARSLHLLLSQKLLARYNELLTRSYVDDREPLKWCPAPECVYAIECSVKPSDLKYIVPTVTCDCHYAFCFGCTLADHQPSPCTIVKRWLKKCADDSETSNWISANTKECPRCQSTIEKNGGCNHMTCRKCRHEFCWTCMGLWSEHGTSWYSCNRFEEKSGSDARDAQAKSRMSLERYLHYYNRYANHEQSARLDKDIFHRTQRKMEHLQNKSGLSWIEVQFLKDASQALQQCRQTLKWTYAFAFYLARNNQTAMFEDNQKDLEMAVENLSEMFEKPTEQLADLKLDMLNKMAYCQRRRVILLDETAKDLRDGKWEYNVDDL